MNKLLGIIKGRTGETLVETIVATLLIAIAFTTLTMMIGIAGNLNRQAVKVSRAIAEDSANLSTSERVPVTLRFTDDITISGMSNEHNVNCDSQNNGIFTMYSVHP